MRSPKFKSIRPNYRKHALEILLEESGKLSKYVLPFAVFRGLLISATNKFKNIEIDSTTRGHSASFILDDGSEGDFPADLVLYYCDPTYDWSPLNQLKKTLKSRLKASKLSLRVLADALNTSPAQVLRLLEEDKAAKQLTQLFQLAQLAGYEIELQLKKRLAA